MYLFLLTVGVVERKQIHDFFIANNGVIALLFREIVIPEDPLPDHSKTEITTQGRGAEMNVFCVVIELIHTRDVDSDAGRYHGRHQNYPGREKMEPFMHVGA